MPDQEREARWQLSCVAEPGDANLGQRIEAIGATAALAEIRAGTSSLTNATWLQKRLSELKNDWPQRQGLTRYLIPSDDQWPKSLNDLGSRRPVGLFVTGPADLSECLSRSISVVGTRSMTNYGRQATNELCGELAYANLCVVSGAAFGVDAAAHKAALAVGGKTLAVLPGGVNDDYPAANGELLNQIRERGVVISEVPDGSRPTRPRFLQRNRIIAALTPATLVIEAPWRSGALSTARWASSLLRVLLGVPGAITAPMSAGVNRLIRQREAEMVTNHEEILECLAEIGQCLAHETINAQTTLDLLSGVDSAVIEALPTRRGAGVEALTQIVDASTSEIVAALGRLELQGLVRHGEHGWVVLRHALYPKT
jgi:DNA processing protein